MQIVKREYYNCRPNIHTIEKINLQSLAKLCYLQINRRFPLRSRIPLHVHLVSTYLDVLHTHYIEYRIHLINFFTRAISFGMHRRWDRQRFTVW